MCVHNHNVCFEIRSQLGHNNNNVGVGFLVCREENDALVIMLGRERSGRYAGLFNICAGGQESVDGRCFIETLKREARQEFKLIFNSWRELDSVLKRQDSTVRWFMFNGTPIFVGVYSRNQFSYRHLQATVRFCARNNKLPWSDREMDDLMMLKTNPKISFAKQIKDYEDGRCIRFDGVNLKISSFAKGCAIQGLNILQREGLFRNHMK